MKVLYDDLLWVSQVGSTRNQHAALQVPAIHRAHCQLQSVTVSEKERALPNFQRVNGKLTYQHAI